MGFFILSVLIDSKFSGTWLMSGENLLSHLPIKFYSEEMTETKKIVYLERQSWELYVLVEKSPMLLSAKLVFIQKTTLLI